MDTIAGGIAFGPVPSRRLGQSLGVNNIPPKACSYSCVYCQLGRTSAMQIERRAFYEPGDVLQEVQGKIERVRALGPIDFITFVPDGEPTLDANLGHEIALLRPLGIPIAVISNASLISREDVREDLRQADWVSLKIDSMSEEVWRRIDRPHRMLRLSPVLDGMLEFARSYKGKLVTETMLVQGVNDGDEQIRELAGFLARLSPACAYLAIPTRPPAEAWVHAPGEETVVRAHQLLSERVECVEYLIGYEGNAFASTGNPEEDLLSITAVHPMREEAVTELLARAGGNWLTVYELIAQGRLVETEYEGYKFYTRKLPGR